MVSILMCAYKEPISYLEKSINSMLHQIYSNIEIIVIVDNPSNNEIINYLQRIEKSDKRLKVYVNEKNIGLPLSLNRGLKYCSGEYIARMDSDDIALPNRLSEQLKFMNIKGYDLVGSSIEIIDENDKYLYSQLLPEDNDKCQAMTKYMNCSAHPTWLVKREVYDSLKGYRNIKHCEDYDFLIRFFMNGYKMGNVSKPLLKYRVNPLGISVSNSSHQRILSDILASYYKKASLMSLKEIDDYENSRKFQKKLENENALNRIILSVKKRKIFSLIDCFKIMQGSSLWNKIKLKMIAKKFVKIKR